MEVTIPLWIMYGVPAFCSGSFLTLSFFAILMIILNKKSKNDKSS